MTRATFRRGEGHICSVNANTFWPIMDNIEGHTIFSGFVVFTRNQATFQIVDTSNCVFFYTQLFDLLNVCSWGVVNI